MVYNQIGSGGVKGAFWIFIYRFDLPADVILGIGYIGIHMRHAVEVREI